MALSLLRTHKSGPTGPDFFFCKHCSILILCAHGVAGKEIFLPLSIYSGPSLLFSQVIDFRTGRVKRVDDGAMFLPTNREGIRFIGVNGDRLRFQRPIP